MESSLQELIGRYLSGELAAGDARALEARLAASAELRAELERQRRLRQLVAESAGQFDPYFATRVLGRVRAQPSGDAWLAGLWQAFRRTALAATVLAGLLVGYNIAVQWEERTDKNAVELSLAIPPTTVASSLDYLDLEQ